MTDIGFRSLAATFVSFCLWLGLHIFSYIKFFDGQGLHIFSYIKFFDGQGTPTPFLLCKGGQFLSKFPDILSMSIFCPLKRKTQRITQGGIGGLYCTNQIKPARREEKRREKKRGEEKRTMECFAHLRLTPLPFATLQVKVDKFSRDPESIKVARMVFIAYVLTVVEVSTAPSCHCCWPRPA